MFYYRIYNPRAAVVTPEIIFGKIIHKAIQDFQDKDRAIDWAIEELQALENKSFMKGSKAFLDKAEVCLENYYEMIIPKLGTGDALVEHKFFISVNKKIAITGTIDRIQNNCIYDWKTSTKAPDSYTLSELQFYVYWWAYRKKFKKDPDGVYYGHLYSGELYNIDRSKARLDNLEALLDKAMKLVYNGLENRTTGNHCRGCLFRGICYSEFENVSIS
jgi:CRISPR/Cas system-associated exonuclease Cas4 (RecB family)